MVINYYNTIIQNNYLNKNNKGRNKLTNDINLLDIGNKY